MKTNSENPHMERLLNDEQFIQWILEPTEELDALWQERMSQDERLCEEIATLKKVLQRLQVEEPAVCEADKKDIWQKIEVRTAERSIPKRNLLKWTAPIAVAASLLLCIVGYHFFMGQEETVPAIDYSHFTQANDSLLKAGDINLVLSNQQRINIKKDSTTIEYNQTGGVRVNSNQDIHTTPDKPELNQLIVPYGKTASLVLSDGTKVRVNSGSRIVYPAVFDKNKREVYISGEALLDVAKNQKVPFVIQTECMQVHVLGTVLNISAYQEDATQSVVLVSGSVEVKEKRQASTYRLVPEQKFTYSSSSHQVDIQKVNVEEYLAWTHDYQILRHEKLPDVLQKLVRHFNIAFAYPKGDFTNISVSGKLDLRGGLRKVLDNISVTVPVDFHIEGDSVTVARKQK